MSERRQQLNEAVMKSAFIEGQNIYLKGLSLEDASESYTHWLNDEEVCRHNGHHYFPNTRAKTESYIAAVSGDSSSLVLAVIEKGEDRHIGNISLQSIDWLARSAEFAILFGEKQYWGRGLAKEAGDLILAHGFNQLNLHRVYCGTSEDNTGMQKLALAMGMQLEGRRREAMYKNGGYRDILEYGILRAEYAARNSMQ